MSRVLIARRSSMAREALEKPEEVFEVIAQLDHPDAEAVLAMFGKHASDKTTAKAARRAAYKASTRRAARR
jgi:N6-adenosine-specific RNA methylase IME4